MRISSLKLSQPRRQESAALKLARLPPVPIGIATIVLANVAEAFGDVLVRLRDPVERRQRIAHEHDLAQRAYFWEGDNKLVITPFPIPVAIAQNNATACGYRNVWTASPRSIRVSLCSAVRSDASLMALLRRTITANPGVVLSPYAETVEFFDLTSRLGHPVGNRAHHRVRGFLRSYLDSKVGFRMEALSVLSKVAHIRIPDGIICQSIDEIVDAVGFFNTRDQSCVAKANSGESGWGIRMFQRGAKPPGVRRMVTSAFGPSTPWAGSPVVVEQFVDSPRSPDDAPSAEVFVSDRSVRVTYVCAQTIRGIGDFHGIALGRRVLRRRDSDRLRRAARLIGRRYQSLGYRGFFDLDAVVSARGDLYVLETNARRTGGTHVYDLARRLAGPRYYTRAYFASIDVFEYPGKRLTASSILARIRHLLFPFGSPQRGFIVTVVSREHPSFGFVLIAPSAGAARVLYGRLNRAWTK